MSCRCAIEAAFRQLLTQSGLCLDLLSVIMQGVCMTVFTFLSGLWACFVLLSVKYGAQTGGHVDGISTFVRSAGDGGSNRGEERAYVYQLAAM